MAETFHPEFMPEPMLFSMEQAARYLNVSTRTIKRLLAARQLVARRIGARVLVPRTSLENFLKRDHETK